MMNKKIRVRCSTCNGTGEVYPSDYPGEEEYREMCGACEGFGSFYIEVGAEELEESESDLPF